MGEVPGTRWPYLETHATHADPTGYQLVCRHDDPCIWRRTPRTQIQPATSWNIDTIPIYSMHTIPHQRSKHQRDRRVGVWTEQKIARSHEAKSGESQSADGTPNI